MRIIWVAMFLPCGGVFHLTYGAATGPRASCVLQPYACATRGALVSWYVRATPRQSIFRNLNIVLTWILIQANKNSEYLHNFLGR
jgi:hypothetical protein